MLRSRRAIRDFSFTASRCFAAQAVATVTGDGDLSGMDISKAALGETIEAPYELTVNDYWRERWQSVFYGQSRIHSSTDFCTNKMGLQDIPLPYSCVMFLASSMSHVDDSREVYDLSFRKAVYNKFVFPGDTLRKKFTICNMTDTSNKKNLIATIYCKLINQYDEEVFSMLKTMMFTRQTCGIIGGGTDSGAEAVREPKQSEIRSWLIKNQDSLDHLKRCALMRQES